MQEGLDARIHKKEEVRLAELQETAESHRVQELERKYAVRYHKVPAFLPLQFWNMQIGCVRPLADCSYTTMQIRFFERVKIERRIKQLKRELQSAEPNTDACSGLQTKLAQATGDLQVWAARRVTAFLGTSPLPHRSGSSDGPKF